MWIFRDYSDTHFSPSLVQLGDNRRFKLSDASKAARFVQTKPGSMKLARSHIQDLGYVAQTSDGSRERPHRWYCSLRPYGSWGGAPWSE